MLLNRRELKLPCDLLLGIPPRVNNEVTHQEFVECSQAKLKKINEFIRHRLQLTRLQKESSNEKKHENRTEGRVSPDTEELIYLNGYI